MRNRTPRLGMMSVIAVSTALLLATCDPKDASEMGHWMIEGRNYRSRSSESEIKRVSPERIKRMTPSELRDQVLGEPISNIEYEYPRVRRER